MFTELGRMLVKRASGGAVERAAISHALGSSPAAGMMGSSQGLGVVGQWDIDYAVRNGLEKVIWVFRCVDVISTNQAGLPILLRKGIDRRNGQLVVDDDLYRLLNFRTNPYERSWQFRYRLSANLLLARRGAFIEIVMGTNGKPAQLHLLPSGNTRPIPDADKFVSGYEVTGANMQITKLPPERVIWLKLKPHPTDPYSQMTPLTAAGIDVDTDYLARVFNRSFLANDGRPGMLISVDGGPGGLNPDDLEELKQRFGGGPAAAGQTTVVEAMNATVQDFGATPRDTQWGDLLSTSKERLLMAFGVPESVMGNASGRTFDNADAERENFWLDTMVPHCDNVAASLDPLSGNVEDNVVFGFDYDGVDVLQRVQRTRREEWRTEFSTGLETLNGYLKRTGQKEIDHPAARARFMPNGLVIAATPEEQSLVEKMPPIGVNALGAGSANVAQTKLTQVSTQQQIQQAAQDGATAGANAAQRSLGNILGARATAIASGKTPTDQTGTSLKAAYVNAPAVEDIVDVEVEEVTKAHPYLTTRHSLEGLVEGVVMAWDSSQGEVIPERLMHTKVRKGTRHWDGNEATVELKSIDSSYVVDITRWSKALTETIGNAVRTNVAKELRSAAADMEDQGLIDVMIDNGLAKKDSGSAVDIIFGDERKQVVDDIVAEALSIVEQAAHNQSKRLQDKIETLDKSGASIKEIQQAIADSLGTRTAWRKALAVNVVTTAIEGARAKTYGAAGKFVTKTWNTVGDERVRRTHGRLDGTVKPSHKAFRVGSSVLQRPGDPNGAPEEVINCRCWLEWNINHDAR